MITSCDPSSSKSAAASATGVDHVEPSDADRGPALIDVTGNVVDHPTLRSKVDRLANDLRTLGLGLGDRIAIVIPNGPEMVLALLAAMAVGCAAPLNPAYREDEFRFY